MGGRRAAERTTSHEVAATVTVAAANARTRSLRAVAAQISRDGDRYYCYYSSRSIDRSLHAVRTRRAHRHHHH